MPFTVRGILCKYFIFPFMYINDRLKYQNLHVPRACDELVSVRIESNVPPFTKCTCSIEMQLIDRSDSKVKNVYISVRAINSIRLYFHCRPNLFTKFS